MVQIQSLCRGVSRVAARLSRVIFIFVLGFSGGANAILIDRGNGLIYDTVLNVTWVQNGNLCLTLGNCVNGDAFGDMNWHDASTWAQNLVFDGISGWRLPYASVSAGVGPTSTAVDCSTASEAACRDNEMGYMFYHDLGGTFLSNETGNQTAVGGATLDNIQIEYWAGTAFNAFSGWLFRFDEGVGIGGANFDDNVLTAWAVHPGDVGRPLAEPATMVLFGVGTLGLALGRRRGRRR